MDFEAGEPWREKLLANGFNPNRPTVIASTGVSMYLTKKANAATLQEISQFAKGSVFVMSFILTLELIDQEEQAAHKIVYERTRAAGTPFLSFFTPQEILSLAHEAGFKKAKHISRADLISKYFKQLPDGLIPTSGEELLIARV